MDSEVIKTYHYVDRCKKYNVKSEHKIDKRALEAFNKGLRLEDFKGRRKEYLMSKVKNGAYPIVYKKFIYIFSYNNVVYTCWPLPKWFVKKNKYESKKKAKLKNNIYYIKED